MNVRKIKGWKYQNNKTAKLQKNLSIESNRD